MWRFQGLKVLSSQFFETEGLSLSDSADLSTDTVGAIWTLQVFTIKFACQSVKVVQYVGMSRPRIPNGKIRPLRYCMLKWLKNHFRVAESGFLGDFPQVLGNTLYIQVFWNWFSMIRNSNRMAVSEILRFARLYLLGILSLLIPNCFNIDFNRPSIKFL